MTASFSLIGSGGASSAETFRSSSSIFTPAMPTGYICVSLLGLAAPFFGSAACGTGGFSVGAAAGASVVVFSAIVIAPA